MSKYQQTSWLQITLQAMEAVDRQKGDGEAVRGKPFPRPLGVQGDSSQLRSSCCAADALTELCGYNRRTPSAYDVAAGRWVIHRMVLLPR